MACHSCILFERQSVLSRWLFVCKVNAVKLGCTQHRQRSTLRCCGTIQHTWHCGLYNYVITHPQYFNNFSIHQENHSICWINPTLLAFFFGAIFLRLYMMYYSYSQVWPLIRAWVRWSSQANVPDLMNLYYVSICEEIIILITSLFEALQKGS